MVLRKLRSAEGILGDKIDEKETDQEVRFQKFVRDQGFKLSPD